MKDIKLANCIRPLCSKKLKELLEDNEIRLFSPEFDIYKAFYRFIDEKFRLVQYDFKKGFIDGQNKTLIDFFTLAVSANYRENPSFSELNTCTVVYERFVCYCTRKKSDLSLIEELNSVTGYKCGVTSGKVHYRCTKRFPLNLDEETIDKYIKEIFKEIAVDELQIKIILEKG